MATPTAPGTILVVVHNFVARSPDELSLTKGDKIELIERDDDFGDGWFLGKHLTNGNTGLFPEVYTRPAPKGTANPSSFAVDKRAVSEDFSNKQASSNASDNRASAPVSMASSNVTSHNSVMNETLDVIKEHINDMHAPHHSRDHSRDHDAPAYAPNRASYIRGQETDEEEQHQLHTEQEVLSWSPARVAEYLEDQGVEKQHCNVFQEQEISGEVLLDMEQSSIFIKEFELGSVGRRLKTWQKVKALQDEVRAAGAAHAPPSVSDYSVGDLAHRRTRSGATDADRQRSFSAATSLNQYLGPMAPGVRPSTSSQNRSNTMPLGGPPHSPQNANAPRPSAQSIRTMNHSRRHSSIGSDIAMQRAVVPQHSPDPTRPTHARAGSSGGPEPQANRLSIFGHRYSLSNGSRLSQNLQDWQGPQGSPDDLDRGYFSGNDLEKQRRRSVLQKKPVSASHSRTPSESADGSRVSQLKVDSPQTNVVLGAAGANKTFGMRSLSTPKPPTQTQGSSPLVTRLEYDNPRSPTFSSETSSTGHSPANNAFSFFTKPRLPGLRVSSEPVGRKEISKPQSIDSPARTGSTTPSTETHSIDQGKSENSTRLSNGSSQGAQPLPIIPGPRSRPRARSKQLTSAYTRGLEKRSPREQIPTADYSGWMKKKSASLVGTWKPRLFVLRGRRLSYYYSENDTEEKGLIDISGHRVLPATSDRVTGLHAQLTGATRSPSLTESTAGGVRTSAANDKALNPSPNPDDDGLFIFKLVPPRQGLSKAVNFTKPTVHYFAVNSRQEGRLWMAALMKATIDHDSTGKVTTSYNQPTISLAKARARKERPPALREGDITPSAEELDEESQGLGILGVEGEEAQAGVEGPAADDDEVSPPASLRDNEAVQLIT